MNTEREAIREVPNLPRITVADRHVRQILERNSG
jgi:hypothetical protein